MKYQPGEHVNHERPSRHVGLVAGMCGLVYGCVFLAANIASNADGFGQSHGWPFVYMERELRVNGDFTIYYGPWPYDNPPLLSFRPRMLFLNAVLGILLSLSLAGSIAYWLRISRRRPVFSLRTLVGAITVVAIMAALSRTFGEPLDLSQAMWFSLFLLLFAASWLVYAAPACLVITAAHWIVLRSAQSSRRRRWCGLHWLTWLTLAIVGGPFLHYAFRGHTGYLPVGRENIPGWISLRLYGWPLGYLGRYEPAASRLGMMEQGFPVSYFSLFALAIDVLTAIAVMTSIAIVVELWIRRIEGRVRPQRRTVISLLLVAAGVTVVLLVDPSFRPSSYAYPCWLFGVASAIWAALAVFLIGVKRLIWR